MIKNFVWPSMAILPLLLSISACASGGWTRQDTNRQAAVAVISAVDWAQTRRIAAHPDKYYEINPILGRHPSRSEVDFYFAGCFAAHTSVAMALPPEWREAWQYLSIGFEWTVVAHNASIGLRLGF